MERNKFERQFKEQMQNREIRPSANAWKKISAQLEASKKPKNKGVLWYAVAASFIGLLIISALFFQSKDNLRDADIQVVDTEKEKPNNVQKNLQFERGDEIEEPLNGIETEAVAVEGNSNQEAIQKKNESTQQDFEAITDKTTILASKETKNAEVKINTLVQDSEVRIDLKIAEVLAQVDLLEQNDEAVTDAEIDSLLRTAQQELMTEGIFKKDNSVDAVALLTEVEDELNQSFRDQIFERLKLGFFKIRTAVADRNN
ncbi:MAG: hypothetical protein ACR2MT_15215 [Aurantibacter sp.]